MTAGDLAALLELEGIDSAEVLRAIATVPRHCFVPKDAKTFAYSDAALPIGHSQTISQPFVVARMTELLLAGRREVKKVLEIGTGSGYQAAVLAEIVDVVYSIERIEPLYKAATALFKTLRYKNIHTQYSDGALGWEAHAPFDAIMVTAATKQIPEALKNQLADGRRMIIPLGDRDDQQVLTVVTRQDNDYQLEKLDPVAFVPLCHGIE